MRITILGTGPAEAIPRTGHRDEACRDARRGGKSRRLRSSVLIQNDDTAILIDAGPDVREQLRGKHADKISAIFLTHMHKDAAGGLIYLPSDIPLYMPETRRTIRVKSLSVAPVPVFHSFDADYPTRGFVINKRMGYVSDCRAIPPRSMSRLLNLDILILDAAAYLGTRIPTHFSVEQAVEIAMRLKPKSLYLTQIGHSYPPHKIAEREIRRYVKVRGCSFPVRLAYDGLRLKV